MTLQKAIGMGFSTHTIIQCSLSILQRNVENKQTFFLLYFVFGLIQWALHCED